MTRAADRLIVSGVEPKAKKDGSDARPANCWHGIVEQALVARGAKVSERPWGEGLVFRSGSPAKARRAKAKKDTGRTAIPAWALTPAPQEKRPPRPLAPSAIAADDAVALPPSEALRAAARRGTLIHSLLERLPDVPEGDRRELALAWLERSAGVGDPTAREEIADLVCGILSDAVHAPLFGPGSLGEAPLAATLADGTVVAGTVDRLLVEAERVSVIDYKTGRAPPGERDIPASHRAQMAAYADALRVIFPGREVRSALLYTAGPRLFDL
jgi:ATP-dependent helicase/nuclease subunit A